MFRSVASRASAGVAGALMIGLLGAAPAFAEGSCGNDFDAQTACPITTAGSYSGTITTASQVGSNVGHDYYVFYARKGTALVVTITNDTPPNTCAGRNCGVALAWLVDGQSRPIASTVHGSDVTPDGVTEPATFSVTLPRTDTYYLKINAELAQGPAGVFTVPVPYTFALNATPDVQWPPPCVIPAIGRRTSLARAEQMLLTRGCALGKVSRKHSTRVKRGDVIAFKPKARTSVAYHSPVAIEVSSGRAPKRRKRR